MYKDEYWTALKGRLEPASTNGSAGQSVGGTMRDLVCAGLDRLPLPGDGHTLERWRVLAQVAWSDLALAKIFEGHTDALAVMAELGGTDNLPGSVWGMWAAEPPDARVLLHRSPNGGLTLSGRKAWCSGAPYIDKALLTAWDEEGKQCLAMVAMKQSGVRVTQDGWNALGMHASCSVDVHFDNAHAQAVGSPGAYLNRPGFWQGGIGVAACWYGGAQAIADELRKAVSNRRDDFSRAHLGAVDIALSQARASLRSVASDIDANPASSAELPALRCRSQMDELAATVVERTGRALGAAAYCKNKRLARLITDLQVYVRQNHAERDLQRIGEIVVSEGPAPTWAL